MTDKLKPCPFCGFEGDRLSVTKEDDCWHVTCRTIDCHGAIFSLGYLRFATKDQAVKAWNTRAEKVSVCCTEAVRNKLTEIKQKLETGPNTQSAIMNAWDSARGALNDYGFDTDFPRSIFEMIIEDLVDDLEECETLLKKVSNSTPLEAGWRTIDSAPKDGTAVLLFEDINPDDPTASDVDLMLCEVCVGSYWEEGEIWVHETKKDKGIIDPEVPITPTHWIPLPSTPTRKERGIT